MKLELKHIAPYLPYNISLLPYDNSKPEPIIGIHQGMVALLKGETDEVDYYDLHEVKPLLLPLASVTENQWMEIFNAGIDEVVRDIIKHYYKPDIFVVPDIIRFFDAKKGMHLIMPVNTIFTINLNPLQFASGHNYVTGQKNSYRFHQLQAIDKMNYFNIDYMGLIDAGLALNKNYYPDPLETIKDKKPFEDFPFDSK